MTEKPHHGDDVKSYLGKDAPLFVRAIKIPTQIGRASCRERV